MKLIPNAQFEISIDGVPRPYLQTGEEIVIGPGQ
jgi:hypothetical protein